ncbi:MAG: RIO1 family regulatory kinase/ATPase [Thermoplasmata archaeon]
MPNDPYLDASVHWKVRSGNATLHEPRYSEVADAILDSGLATSVLQQIGSGKEAGVFACLNGEHLIAVKSYRFYQSSHRGGRPIKQESMGRLASQELELLTQAWCGGARVPRPGRRVENMFSMQYLGSPEGPAPRLIDVGVEAPAEFLDELLASTRKLADAGVVHSDLSPFNILVHEELPWFIDMGQGVRVDRIGMSPWVRLTQAGDALRRGFKTYDRYFRKYGLRVDVDGEVAAIVTRLDRFGVLR